MPNDSNDISNDELVMDEDVWPDKSRNNVSHPFSSNCITTPSKNRKPVMPLFIGFLCSLALFVGLCFVSAWFSFGFIISAGLFIFTVNNNNYNNAQEAYLFTPTPLEPDTIIPDLVIENTINNGKNINPRKNDINTQDNFETPTGNQNIKETTNREKKFKQDLDTNLKSQQDTKSNIATKTNLDLINAIHKDSNKIGK